MIVYFNIYGSNLYNLTSSDIEFSSLSFFFGGKQYILDLAGSIDMTFHGCFEGRIKCDEVDIYGNKYDKAELECALKNSSSMTLNAYINTEKETDAKLTSYDIHVIIGDVDKIEHKDFDI